MLTLCPYCPYFYVLKQLLTPTSRSQFIFYWKQDLQTILYILINLLSLKFGVLFNFIIFTFDVKFNPTLNKWNFKKFSVEISRKKEKEKGDLIESQDAIQSVPCRMEVTNQ